jgi:hypothetical protein
MQVFGLPGHVIRGGRVASRLLDAKTSGIAAAGRRDAVARWRLAMRDGLTGEQAARAVGVPRASLYRWEASPELRSRRPRRLRAKTWSSDLVRGCCQSNANLSPLRAGRAGDRSPTRRASATQPRRLIVGPCMSLC